MKDEKPIATPRERLEFNISNKVPLIGIFNGHNIKIRRIRLRDIENIWKDVLGIFQMYQNDIVSIRLTSESEESGDLASTTPDSSNSIFESLEKLGPNIIDILHNFIKASTDATDEILNEADFPSIVELVVLILEHNVSEELIRFFGRGGKVLETLGLKAVADESKNGELDSNPSSS